jgi:arabinogalactan oligomer / maltooligosaccharide transport system permease protein
MTINSSQRRRFALGLLFGLLVGLGIEYWIYLGALAEENLSRARREGIITVLSFADVANQTIGEGDVLRTAVLTIAKENNSIKQVRIVRGVTLEASTDPKDTGDKAAPRRLSRDEKWVFDLGQRLRASVLTNREEGTARKDEIEVAPAATGGLTLSTPVEKDGSVVGFVQVETKPSAGIPAPPWTTPLLLLIAAILIFWILSKFIGEKRIPLAVLSLILLIATLAWYGNKLFQSVKADRLSTENAIASKINEESVRRNSILKTLGIAAAPFQSSSLDSDVFRRPRGLISDSGAINQQMFSQEMHNSSGQILKIVIGIAMLAIVILAFFGFGGAAKLASTLVRYREAYSYTAPAMLGMLVLVFFPFFYGIALSFTGSTLYNTDKSIPEIWTGLKNYIDILGDFSIVKHTAEGLVFNYQNFYYTLLFTILWTVSNVTIGVTVGLILALILNTKGLALRPLYRVLLIFPWAMPNYITALIWRGMFHQQYGVINQVIQMFGGEPVSWFQKPFTSFLTALATNGWLSFPFMMVVSLGALQSIPSDLYEAARVDGATRWQQFRSITLPSLRPALVPAIILSVVWTFNMFNIIFLVTAGEPAGSTEILITQAYKIAFQQYRYGYAAAYSTVIFLILLIYGTLQNKLTRATEAIAE